MVNAEKCSTAGRKKGKGPLVSFGKFHEYVQLGEDIEEAHELTEKEKALLIQDFKSIKKIEKEEVAELEAIKHFEKKLQELIGDVVYLEGYIQQIESGNSMLKINTSVKELGTKLTKNIEEIENLSGSILDEERKILDLAKHVKQILGTAKKYQKAIFG